MHFNATRNSTTPRDDLVVHRNPNHIAKDITDECNGVNPLVGRLYSDSMRGTSSMGMPNSLVCSVGHDALRSHPTPTPPPVPNPEEPPSPLVSGSRSSHIRLVHSLQVYTQPMYSDAKLKSMFRTLQAHTGPGLSTKRRRQPHKLQPLPATAPPPVEGRGGTVPEGENAVEDESTAASPPYRIPRFEKITSDAPNEFAYLMARPRGLRERFDPYDLHPVSHKDLKGKPYYTVSAAGVTRFTGGAAEFMELSTWERDCRLFHQISDLPVFKNYKKWRSFLLWRGLVRRQAMSSSRQFLMKNLFYVHPQLAQTLQLVRRMCLEFGANNNFYVSPGETLTLEEFCQTLGSHLSAQQERLEKMLSTIRDHVDQACKAAILASQLEREQVQQFRSEEDKRKRKVVDIRELGAQQQPSYVEVTQRRAICKRLTAFIKLCDYLIIACLSKLAVKATASIAADLSYPKQEGSFISPSLIPTPASTVRVGHTIKEKKLETPSCGAAFEGPLLSVEVLYDEKEQTICINPSQSRVTEAVDDIIRDYVRTANSIPRLVTMDLFKVYTTNGGEETAGLEVPGGGPDVAEMILAEEVYKSSLVRISSSFSRCFSEVRQYVRSFDVYRDMYITNAAMDTDAILRRHEPIEFFRDHLTLFKNQMDAVFCKIPNSKDVALIRVYSENLREFFTPSPASCLEAFRHILPIIAHRHNEELLAELQKRNSYLGAFPRTVEHYVEYLYYYHELELELDAISARYEFVRELLSLMQEDKIAVSEDDEETFRNGTRPQFDKLRTLVQVVEDGKESQQRLFSRNIDEQMEQLRHRIEEVYDKAGQPIVMSGEAEMEEVIPYITELQQEAEGIAAREKELRRYQLEIGAEETTVDTMLEMLNDVNIKVKLWVGIRDWQAFVDETREQPFGEVDVGAVQDMVQKFTTLVKQVVSKLNNTAAVKLRARVEEWRQLMPILHAFTNPKMKPEHHSKVSAVMGEIEDSRSGVSKTLAEWGGQYTIAMLLENDVLSYNDEILSISATAIEEDKLQQQIDKVNAMWNGGGPKPAMEFQFNHHKDFKNVFTLVSASVDDVVALLDDSLIAISTIGSSRCCQGVLRAQVDRWEARIQYMQETLDKWVEYQRNWVYLENIFSSSEIRSQWKDDAKRFEKADRFFRDLMRKAHDLPTAYRGLLINPPSFDANEPAPATKVLKQELVGGIAELERVLASMEKKLEEKRRAFPRFYFLSNDDLLDILAKVKTPELMMPHMLKIFDGIKTLGFDQGSTITHLISMEGERVELVNQTIKARGSVEVWMDFLEKGMFSTLRQYAQACLEDYEIRGDRNAWMFQHPAQLVLIMEQLLWTRSVEEALNQKDSPQRMNALKETNYRALEELATLTSQKLSRLQRTLLSTMITIDVHGRDLVDDMCASNVLEVKEFGWTKQLRVYWEQDADGQGNIFIRQNNSRFVYGYEYLGAQGRLVITPLTDRIYMTVTGALKLYLGASPAGPAGTGKTETVKDLAKNLARQCIVYNCSDGVTYKMMEKFFLGLVQTGAWACLDEFNRINIEVLSVIASQLLEIKMALQSCRKSFTFQGITDVRVRTTYGVFITMNPGYAGRTELPDNLKILFRPVAVMTPDFRMIAEVILYAEGFKNAKELSLKITQLYKLSSEQLSPQDHYDFGMRALKSILVMAGDLKRSQPDVPEDLTLIVACNDSNVPKFIAEDLPLFQGIMQDLFPGVTFPARQYEELLPAMHRVMEARKLADARAWLTKGIQFFETLIVRHGVMLVGAAGTGKTEVRRCIAESLTAMGAAGSCNAMARAVHQSVLNPKAILLHELYGQLDVNTNEWKDGVLATIVKQCVRDSESSRDHRWIVMDGPVDTLWIESLNSVLDDSKLLCLDNGERIKLPDTIHMLFEVADLAVASPATVSRCGMVYIDVNDLPWRAIVHQWAETKLAEVSVGVKCRHYITALFDTYIDKGLAWLQTQCQLISAGNINVVQSMCDLFTALLQDSDLIHLLPIFEDSPSLPPDDPVFQTRNEVCNALFVFVFVWSIGGNVDQAGMESLDTLARTLFESLIHFPNHGTVFDFTIDFKTRLLTPWESKLPEFTYDSTTPFFNILVPTVDTVRYSTLARTLLRYGKPLLFNGHTGVGKSVIMADCLRANKEALQLSLITFQFSAQTSSQRTQELIESKLKQKRKNILGAAPGRKIALFIDDLNMPALEVFGASPPIELLRQLMGEGGFYDRKVAGFWKHVQDVTVVAACGPPEGGRNPLTPRLTRLFHLLQIPNLTDDSMRRIFGCILHGFLESRNFSKEVKEAGRPLVLASVDLFTRLSTGLRPRPTTPHYTFNLRDLAKVFQGITQVVPRVCRDAKTMVRLWVHECMRCFYDRLATAEDRRFFIEELMADSISRLPHGGATPNDFFAGPPIVWADFLRLGATEKVYEEVTDFRRLPQILEEHQDNYNANADASGAELSERSHGMQAAAQLNMVFFKDHCEHLSRIIRVIRQPRGNVLLVGVGGSGKRSLTRLAAYVAECSLFEVTVGKGFSMSDFHEFLLEVYTTAGVHCRPCVLLLSDTQIVHEAMFEDVNNILNSGEVPSLFNMEEREKRVNACLEAAQELGITSREDVYNFFISRVRDNLHIALCMSPVGDTFRTRCRQFPSLTNCCSIDWLTEWPPEALTGVSTHLLKDLQGVIPEAVFAVLPALCMDVHSCIEELAQVYWEEARRRYYVTPTSYLEFIEMYKGMYLGRRAWLQGQLARLENGMQKMKETHEMIGKMRGEIEVKRPQLEQASKETEVVVVDLKARQDKAAEMQVQVRAQQASAAEQQQEALCIAAEANSRLAEAKPIIDRAKAALDTIQASDINELRSFANPPSAVLKTAQACMTMFDPKDFNGAWSGGTDWKGAREFLSHRPLLDMIRGYPTDSVKPATLQKIQKYINDDEFTVDVCSLRGSQTCGSLCAWVHAVNEYSKVVKEVAPMRRAAAEAEEHLSQTNAKLNAAQKLLQEVENELGELEGSYQKSLKRKNDLEAGLRVCVTRLENAEALSSSLKSECARWSETAAQLTRKLDELPLEIFLASACAAYCGAFTPAFRKRALQMWVSKFKQHGLDMEGSSLIRILGDPVDTLSWQVNGLPTDDTSTENAIIAMLSNAPHRWPLFIDPQEQGIKWIVQQFHQSSLNIAAGATTGPSHRVGKHAGTAAVKVVRLTDSTWMRTLEMQIRVGGVVIIDDIGEMLDPALDLLIARRITTTDGGMRQIQLTLQSGPIDYHPNFRLFLCTKLSNPHYLPDISTRVALINFTVTREGLEDQLLGEVVGIEKRELEREKNHNIESISQSQLRLKAIEQTILERLNTTKGNILDDSQLVAELKAAQSSAKVISAQQIEANRKMEIISVSREKYRSVAARASTLFFVLADIARVDFMYQYSLHYFVKLVQHEIEHTAKPPDYDEERETMLQEHLSTATEQLTLATYTQICRGLFNRDKIILSVLMATAIARQQNNISDAEWQYFIRATALVPSDMPPMLSELHWMSRQQWELVHALTHTIPVFCGFVDSLTQRPAEWEDFATCDEPQMREVPCGWEDCLTPFQKILLMRALREEKLYFALIQYVNVTLGTRFVEPPPFDLVSALRDSSPTTPIIFVLSQGADPMDALQACAKSEGRELHYVSLGQGQGENAKRLIASCRTSGSWALLQNCHLSKSFMPELEQEVAKLQESAGSTHMDFRLWLTSMPTDFFPVFVLQTGIKLTNEPPTGLRANMLRCFGDLTPADYSVFGEDERIGNYPKNEAFKKLLYGLCFFHSIVLERKKFGPLGWNVKYEWNDTDFHVSKQWLQLFFEEQEAIPWDSLEYIIGQINYGGRVTDPQDRGTLQTIMRRYLSRTILDDAFSFSDSGKYTTPCSGSSLEDTRQHIAAMSLVDEPEVFGMHEDASLRYQLQTSHYLLSTVMSIQPRLSESSSARGGGSVISPEEEVFQKCREFASSLPSLITKEEAGPTSFTTLPNGLPNSMSTVLVHEMVKYNRLLSRMQQTLTDLDKALRGLTVLSADLDAMYTSFLNDQVPQLWAAVSYTSLKPLGAWYREFLEKIKFIRTWVRKGEPKAFWIGGLFNLGAFMTGISQAFARAEKVSVDKLGLKYTVISSTVEELEVEAGPSHGCYVYGIFADAWRWDNIHRVMADSLPREPYAMLPVLHFLPEAFHQKPSDHHALPLYRTTVRAGVISSLGASSNYVLSIEFPSTHSSDYWLLKGAACVCALDS